MPFVILPTNSASGGYDITNSLRFNAGSTDYLSRTPSTTTNRRTWTWSSWVKKSVISSTQVLFTAYTSNTDSGYLFARIDNGTGVIRIASGTGSINFITTPVYRDVSAWYHVVFAVDTTQATSTNRVKIYINGNQVTDFSTGTYPAQNFDSAINGNWSHNIGRDAQDGSGLLNGYLSDVYLIDGQQLTPTSFGETDEDTGIWKPKAYTGTYGTNGFYLQFKNSASLGTDSSGNGNTFTVNNLTSVDQSTDTPTNNFATLNPLGNFYPNHTFSEGNLKIVTGSAGGSYSYNLSTIGVSTGKWYWETKVTKTSVMSVGISSRFSTSADNEFGINPARTDGYAYVSNGNVYNNGSTILTGMPTYTTGDIIGVALDVTNNKLYFSKNGTFINSGNPSSGTNGISINAPSGFDSGNYFSAFGDDDTASETFEINFGNPPYTANGYTDGAGYGNFSYSVPAGFYSLNTKNLAQFG